MPRARHCAAWRQNSDGNACSTPALLRRAGRGGSACCGLAWLRRRASGGGVRYLCWYWMTAWRQLCTIPIISTCKTAFSPFAFLPPARICAIAVGHSLRHRMCGVASISLLQRITRSKTFSSKAGLYKQRKRALARYGRGFVRWAVRLGVVDMTVGGGALAAAGAGLNNCREERRSRRTCVAASVWTS